MHFDSLRRSLPALVALTAIGFLDPGRVGRRHERQGASVPGGKIRGLPRVRPPRLRREHSRSLRRRRPATSRSSTRRTMRRCSPTGRACRRRTSSRGRRCTSIHPVAGGPQGLQIFVADPNGHGCSASRVRRRPCRTSAAVVSVAALFSSLLALTFVVVPLDDRPVTAQLPRLIGSIAGCESSSPRA